MGTLASLAPFLKPLNGIRANPYTNPSGARGEVLAVGSPDGGYRANDSSPAGMVGDSGPNAEYDRAMSAEAAASRGNELSNWLDEQRAGRVDAMLERDDPEAAARVRATQMASLRPRDTQRPMYNELTRLMTPLTPTAQAGRKMAFDERMSNTAAEDTAARERGYVWDTTKGAMLRRRLADEARQQQQQTRGDELSAETSPLAMMLREVDITGRERAARAANPPDPRAIQMQAALDREGDQSKRVTVAEVQAEIEGTDLPLETAIERLESRGYTVIRE